MYATLEKEKLEFIQNAKRKLSTHRQKTPQQIFKELADFTSENASVDVYGAGQLINDFEREMADLLGKESAVFMPSGIMANQVAMRIHTDQKDCSTVAFHPLSHVEVFEENSYAYLHQLEAILLGTEDQLMTANDFKEVEEEIACLLVELPQRSMGGFLPKWRELVELVRIAKEKEVLLHLDGARLWESTDFLGKKYHEITSLFDSVYVSFYKILGGISGAILAGSETFVQEAKVWQRRHGGNIIHQFPAVIAAQKGIKEDLPKIPSYIERAREVAKAINELEGVETLPKVPHTNMFKVMLGKKLEEVVDKAFKEMMKKDLLLFKMLQEEGNACSFEVHIGNAAEEVGTEEVCLLLKKIMA